MGPPHPQSMLCHHVGWMMLDQVKRGDPFFVACR
ncbi:hypothetical protein AFE_2812 [Acidithiobacillus ferrooxidans ATCC 23270]|uniref:Uncharacterized protein n=1 Tax=Acidithiobacillus ferrooxidans (strain ATCC 23270 / DSM 14882 / CIP 104768 / NCIMB 8455) TaxID=243159 RepID=B7J905_ACIF2|nr:hypothetical protein AFE_2812 [Acidithiobacillus ferrooxidans ATCC 23270]